LQLGRRMNVLSPTKYSRDDTWPDWLNEVVAMAARGGPTSDEFARLGELIDLGVSDVASGRTSREIVRRCLIDLHAGEPTATIQGFGLVKPHGYAGDFEIIDRIYTRWHSPYTRLARWDVFFHEQAAPKAVRNRADVLAGLLDQAVSISSRARVLNVGSGPCRDIARWLDANPLADVEIECVDRDPKAHAYGSSVLNENVSRVRQAHRDILHYRPAGHFDLVWSAGLFDYLSDRLFVVLLRRLMGIAGPHGRVVIGNFSTTNPSRGYMELFGEWYLHHRSESDLLRLAKEANASHVHVTVEGEGVNLFLHING
jgi:extracellular factor (EF) 3-hydroxypalmitic acid methyl ester biosynthesis protein